MGIKYHVVLTCILLVANNAESIFSYAYRSFQVFFGAVPIFNWVLLPSCKSY